MAFFAEAGVSIQIADLGRSEIVKAWFSCIFNAIPIWLRFYFVFSKAILFIWGLALCHSIVEYTTVCMLMLYLVTVMKKHLFMAAITINILDGLSSLLAFVVAYVATAYTDRFSVIVFSTTSYIMGLILLWVSLCSPSEGSLFNVAILLIALGKSGGGSTLRSFLEYQLTHAENQSTTEQHREVGTKIWWHSARISGVLVSIFVVLGISKASWLHSFRSYIFWISALVVLLANFSNVLFFYGNRFYKYENPTKTSLAHVLKQLKAAKFNTLHLWVSFVTYGVVLTIGNTLFIAQITHMNLSFNMVIIPIMFVLKSLTCDIVNFMFWWAHSTKKRVTGIRIGAGMICSVICCVVAREVELYRLKMRSMSVLWLIPQFLVLGLMEGLVGGGLVRHIYGNVCESMRDFIAEPLSELVVCVGKFSSIILMSICSMWFGENINNFRDSTGDEIAENNNQVGTGNTENGESVEEDEGHVQEDIFSKRSMYKKMFRRSWKKRLEGENEY
ncbi:protein NRT1/ PTR FAMILY 5.7-like [Senna tora]|uniref:Protein NRT1/ PTR FAMILY 5.7-like n=1 Tax=Senna tora TaxID=362788 RepID=A0A834XK90_9FABA|nr:protein NRT1/ PTR FAMILY 5.7-like [Senna tora]